MIDKNYQEQRKKFSELEQLLKDIIKELEVLRNIVDKVAGYPEVERGPCPYLDDNGKYVEPEEVDYDNWICECDEYDHECDCEERQEEELEELMEKNALYDRITGQCLICGELRREWESGNPYRRPRCKACGEPLDYPTPSILERISVSPEYSEKFDNIIKKIFEARDKLQCIVPEAFPLNPQYKSPSTPIAIKTRCLSRVGAIIGGMFDNNRTISSMLQLQ